MAIELLLLEDVESLGRKGNVVKVRPGYARNYLVPNQLAIVADKNTLRKRDRLQQEREKQAVQDREESLKLSQELEGKIIKTFVKVDHDGHMYGSVTSLDIVHLVENTHNIKLDKHSISLKHHLKKLGKHTVEIKLKEGVTTSIIVKILAEGAVEEEEEPKTEEA